MEEISRRSTVSPKWSSRAWITVAYFLPGSLGILVSILFLFGTVLGLKVGQVNLVVIIANAVARRVFEVYSQGQLPAALERVFLCPSNGATGAPITFIAGITVGVIYLIITDYDIEDRDDDDDKSYFAKALRHASLRPLVSIVFGVTLAATIFRLRDPSTSVGCSALCGWAGVLVLVIPLALLEALLLFLVMRVLSPTYLFVTEVFSTRLSKGYELWKVAAEGEIALLM